MKLTVGILLCFAFAVQASQRITGGKITSISKYPYLVSLQTAFNHVCGGTILNDCWILTAAHCAIGQRLMYVYAGIDRLDQTSSYYRTSVDKVIIHENYNASLHLNDIALVRVYPSLKFNEKIQSVAIDSVDNVGNGLKVMLPGWGRVQNGGSLSNDLRETELTVVNKMYCNYFYHTSLSGGQICAFTEGKGACYGDDGGPLIADGYAIGISSTVSCGLLMRPEIYTKVYNYVDWIFSKIY